MTLTLAGSPPSLAALEEAGLAPASSEGERLSAGFSGRRFTIAPAIRRPVPLLLGLAGPSGSGKTYSALRLATGIARVASGDVVVIDTENKRAQHYADLFKFSHIDFAPPYGPMDYLAAIQTAERTKPACIVIDSLSHEHDGEGGTLDCVTAEFVEFYSQALRSQRTVGASIEVALAPDREINSGFRGTRVSHQCTFGKATGDTIIP